MASRREQIDTETRKLLARLASSERTRSNQWTRERPAKWQPTEVRDPRGGFFPTFSDHSAWAFVAEKLAEGLPVEVMKLRKPAGRRGYVLKVELELDDDSRTLYVKLELNRSKTEVYGRSFHYSSAR